MSYRNSPLLSRGETRREFIKKTAAVTVAVAAGACPATLAAEKPPQTAPESLPWYRRALRWGQTNITEKDPTRYDIPWWRSYWKRTQVSGVIINAGGIFAYYPSKYPLHHRPEFLGDRDLYGELAKAAHDDGLFVLARMDSNRADEAFYKAHPDWFALDFNGRPYRAGELYVACVNSPYYDEWIPGILREIIERSHPEGFADNSWSGLGRGSICFCDNCAKKFRAATKMDLPKRRDWNSPAYRQWIQWSYARRLEIWDINNRTTKAAGGPNCLWIGMNSGSVSGQCGSFRDYKEICKRAEVILLDHQARSDSGGFQQNGDTGKMVHGLLGWDKLMPESMALYQNGRPTFRLSAKPPAEARMWMIEGFAGGIQPWWHHVGAYQEDRRAYRTAEPVLRWHKANEQYLVNRLPIATVGVVWSQRCTDFYGRDDADVLTDLPYRGIMQALIRARIPYLPVHVDHVERDGDKLALLILPNLGALSKDNCASIRRFVERGGGLIATGETSRYDEWGDPHPDFALADLFGAHVSSDGKKFPGSMRRWAAETYHTYLRLSPELRAGVEGPKAGDEPAATGKRHLVLAGFEETDILPFGGMLEPLQPDAGAVVPMTFIPNFPIYPPETAWMREPRTNIPGLVLNEKAKGGRVAFLPADIDRRFGRDNLPDQGNLLANLFRWASGGEIPLQVAGAGLVDFHLYRQPGRFIMHVVNLTSAAAWRAPVDELIAIGPLQIKVQLPDDVRGKSLALHVSEQKPTLKTEEGWAEFELKSVLDHELVVIE